MVWVSIRDRGVNSLFVSAGDSPHLIKDLPFVLERKRLSAAIGAVDNQIVFAAHSARERKSFDLCSDEFLGQIHRRAQIVLVETSRQVALTASASCDDR